MRILHKEFDFPADITDTANKNLEEKLNIPSRNHHGMTLKITTHRKKTIFIIAIFLNTLAQVTSDMYLPSLPAISHSLHATIHIAQLTVSFYMFGIAISQLIYGPLSDGIGRRRPLLFGLLLCLIGSLVCVSAQNINVLILGRLLQGLGTGACSALFRPIIRDLFGGTALSKYSSYAAIIGIWFLAISPLIGGYIQHYIGWHANFAVLTGLAAFIFTICLILLPETNLHRHKKYLKIRKILSNMATLLTSRVFVIYCACSLLIFGVIAAWLTASPIILQKVVGLNAMEYGWCYFATGVAFIGGSIVNARYVNRLGIQNMLQIGIWGIFGAGILMMELQLLGYINIAVILGPTLIVFFCIPLVLPNTFAGAFHPFPKIAGIAAAIFGFSRMLGGAGLSWLIAASHDQNQFPMACAFIVCPLLAGLVYYLLRPRLY